jgi:hypothetical protein
MMKQKTQNVGKNGGFCGEIWGVWMMLGKFEVEVWMKKDLWR